MKTNNSNKNYPTMHPMWIPLLTSTPRFPYETLVRPFYVAWDGMGRPPPPQRAVQTPMDQWEGRKSNPVPTDWDWEPLPYPLHPPLVQIREATGEVAVEYIVASAVRRKYVARKNGNAPKRRRRRRDWKRRGWMCNLTCKRVVWCTFVAISMGTVKDVATMVVVKDEMVTMVMIRVPW